MRQTEYMTHACDPKILTVAKLMQDAVVTCRPAASGITVAHLLTDWNVGSLPVVEADRTLVGLVSESDLLDALLEGKDLRTVTAADLMTHALVTATEDMLLQELAALLQDRSLIRVPVVKGKTLVGIVARRDIVFGCLKAMAHYWP